MRKNLAQKRVLITGASGGIGKDIALAFGKAGCKVIVHYHTRKEAALDVVEQIAERSEACALYADLRSESAIQRLSAEAIAVWGGIDILVNNAGIILKAQCSDTDAMLWDDTMAVNVRAPHLLSQHIACDMQKRQAPGVILHNSSIHAQNSTAGFAAYAASKAALEALSKVQALEWAESDIRVLCVAPGVVPVERTATALEASKETWMAHMPAGRYGRGDEIGEMMVYLASDKAGWMTGQSFIIDGGMSARGNYPQRPAFPKPDRPTEIDHR